MMLENLNSIYLINNASFLIFLLKSVSLERSNISCFFLMWRTAFHRIMKCCFIFCLVCISWVILCKTRCATKIHFWCSCMKCSSSARLASFFENYLWRMFFIAELQTESLQFYFKNDFFNILLNDLDRWCTMNGVKWFLQHFVKWFRPLMYIIYFKRQLLMDTSVASANEFDFLKQVLNYFLLENSIQ